MIGNRSRIESQKNWGTLMTNPFVEIASSISDYPRPPRTLRDFALKAKTYDIDQMHERGRRIMSYIYESINRDLRESFDGYIGMTVKYQATEEGLIEYPRDQWSIQGGARGTIFTVKTYVVFSETNRHDIIIEFIGQRAQKSWKISLVQPTVDGVLDQLRYVIVDEMKYYV